MAHFTVYIIANGVGELKLQDHLPLSATVPLVCCHHPLRCNEYLQTVSDSSRFRVSHLDRTGPVMIEYRIGMHDLSPTTTLNIRSRGLLLHSLGLCMDTAHYENAPTYSVSD